MSDQDRPGFDVQADDAATIMKMARVFDVRSVEGADMDAIRDLLRRIRSRYPHLRDAYPLDGKLGLGKPL
jgi:hypothetical protein